MREASRHLVALCRTHQLWPEDTSGEDALAILLEQQAEREGVDLDALQLRVGAELRAESTTPRHDASG